MGDFPYKTFVFDMDGTLLNAHNELSVPLNEKLHEMKSQGYRLIIATGRTFGEVQAIIKHQIFDGYICSNAMSIYNEQQQRIKHVTLPPQVLPTILEEASKHNIYYELRQDLGPGCVAKEHYPYMQEIMKPKTCAGVSEHEWNSRKAAIHQLEFLDQQDIEQAVKIYFFQPDPKKLALWRTALEQLIAPFSIAIESSSVNSCEIVHTDATKGKGLQTLVEMGIIVQEDIVCFGDSFNDMSMFNFAKYRVAMKNANEQLKALANEVTQYTNGEDGVLQWLVTHIKE